jgi:hypothetical protein
MKKLAGRSLLTHWLLSILLVVLALDCSSVSAAGARDAAKTPRLNMTLRDGKLTAQIRTAPLHKVIEEIGRLTGAEVRWLSQGEEDQVSAEFADLPLYEALETILKENFTLSYTIFGKEKKLTGIWILSSGKRSESVLIRQSITATTLSMLHEGYAENAPEWGRTRARKDPKDRVEREEW